jgi:eukaryotic-like serine/threonine-protein kinase
MITAGAKFGYYEIIRQLGAGGMGEVFLAEDSRLRRKIALKVLPENIARDKDRLRRFEQEAFAASALNHPNILTIYEFGAENGIHFLATEFVEGETLRERQRREPLTLREVLDVAAQVASALNAAHSAGIVHRDIKPENVMIRDDGLVKVLDFGLAKLTEKKTEPLDSEGETRAQVKTSPGMVMGTAAYMSPEQARGKETDARSDIWSLGVLLYEMLAGQQPFTGETTTDTLAAILHREPAPLAEKTPPELARIIRKALQKDKDERYQTSKDLWIDLKNLKRELELAEEIERSNIPAFAKSANVGANQSGESATPIHPKAISTQDVGAAQTASSAEYIVGEIKQHKRGFFAVLSVLFLVAAGFGYWFYASHSASSGAGQINSIAVLPFENGGGNPDNEYLSDGMTESLINSLSQLPNMKVIARASVFRYKGKETDLQKIAGELNVRALITGRVVQRGDTLDISVNLTDAQNNTQLWGQRYSRKLADVFAVQDEIAKQVTSSLRVKLTGDAEQRLTKRYTDNEEAYKLYLQGRFQWNKRTGESLKKAVEFYKQAIEKDPNFALAYAGLAESYVLFPVYSVASPKDIMPQAKAAAVKALEIDDSLAEAHAALGVYQSNYAWNQPASERELRRAIELNPNYATAHHWLGNCPLTATGRFDEAVTAGRRAEELDPLSPIISADTGSNLLLARRYDEAIAKFKHALTLDPNFPYTHWILGQTYHAKGMYAEAVAEFRKALQLDDEPFAKAWLARSLAHAGERDEALKLLEQLKTDSAQRYVPSIVFVVVYAALGDKDEAFAWLEKDFAERSLTPPYYAVDPALDDLRGDPRFNEFIKRAKAAVMNE